MRSNPENPACDSCKVEIRTTDVRVSSDLQSSGTKQVSLPLVLNTNHLCQLGLQYSAGGGIGDCAGLGLYLSSLPQLRLQVLYCIPPFIALALSLFQTQKGHFFQYNHLPRLLLPLLAYILCFSD